MFKKIGLVALGAILTAAPALAVNVNWADWETRSGGTVTGTLSTSLGDVGVTYSNAANALAFAQLTGGTDYWQNGRSGRDAATSPYTSTGASGNDNIPTGTDIIAMSTATTHTLVFGQEVRDLYFSFVSINGNTLSFDTPFEILSVSGQNIDGAGTDTAGYWGSGSLVSGTNGSKYTLSATNREPHGTILLRGVFTTLSFTTSLSENWHGMTVGVADAATPAVPLPAGVTLLAGALAALGIARRRA